MWQAFLQHEFRRGNCKVSGGRATCWAARCGDLIVAAGGSDSTRSRLLRHLIAALRFKGSAESDQPFSCTRRWRQMVRRLVVLLPSSSGAAVTEPLVGKSTISGADTPFARHGGEPPYRRTGGENGACGLVDRVLRAHLNDLSRRGITVRVAALACEGIGTGGETPEGKPRSHRFVAPVQRSRRERWSHQSL